MASQVHTPHMQGRLCLKCSLQAQGVVSRHFWDLRAESRGALNTPGPVLLCVRNRCKQWPMRGVRVPRVEDEERISERERASKRAVIFSRA